MKHTIRFGFEIIEALDKKKYIGNLFRIAECENNWLRVAYNLLFVCDV